MVNIDRIPGVALIEAQMIDTCIIRRDNMGVYDDVLNEATGLLEKPDNDIDSTIYTGKCLIALVDKGDKETPIADMPKEIDYHKVLVPQDSSTSNVRIGDIITIVNSLHDPSLDGKEFRISKTTAATHPVYRRFMAEEIIDSIGTNNPAAS
jgi:hypothetical protein